MAYFTSYSIKNISPLGSDMYKLAASKKMKKQKLTRKEKIKKSQLAKRLKKSESEKQVGIWFILIGMAFIGFFGNLWLNRNHEIKKDDLQTIDGVVTNELKKEWKRRTGNFISIKLQNYPNINFKLSGTGIKSSNSYLLRKNTKIGDSISIDIKKEEYPKLAKNEAETIFIYGLRDKDEDYLNIKIYNSVRKKDRNSISMYLLLGFSFWMFGFGIYYLMKNRIKPAVNPT